MDNFTENFYKLLKDGVMTVGMEQTGNEVFVFLRRNNCPPPNEVRFALAQTEGSWLDVALVETPHELMDRVIGRMKLVE